MLQLHKMQFYIKHIYLFLLFIKQLDLMNISKKNDMRLVLYKIIIIMEMLMDISLKIIIIYFQWLNICK